MFGAGLDVFDQEPPPPDNPLFKLDNVLLTSHFAGPTFDNPTARFRNAFDNFSACARREAVVGGAGTGRAGRLRRVRDDGPSCAQRLALARA